MYANHLWRALNRTLVSQQLLLMFSFVSFQNLLYLFGWMLLVAESP